MLHLGSKNLIRPSAPPPPSPLSDLHSKSKFNGVFTETDLTGNQLRLPDQDYGSNPKQTVALRAWMLDNPGEKVH